MFGSNPLCCNFGVFNICMRSRALQGPEDEWVAAAVPGSLQAGHKNSAASVLITAPLPLSAAVVKKKKKKSCIASVSSGVAGGISIRHRLGRPPGCTACWQEPSGIHLRIHRAAAISAPHFYSPQWEEGRKDVLEDSQKHGNI